MGVVTIAIRVKPGSSRTKVGGAHEGPYGQALIVAVNAPPVDGRATEAAIAAVADALGLRSRDVRLRAGTASRDKLLAIEGDEREITARAAILLGPAFP